MAHQFYIYDGCTQIYGGEQFREIVPLIKADEVKYVEINQDWHWKFRTSRLEGIKVVIEAIWSGHNDCEQPVLDMMGGITIKLKKPRVIEEGAFHTINIPISPQYPERHLGQPILDAFLKLKQMKNQGILINEYPKD